MHWFYWFLTIFFLWQCVLSLIYVGGWRPKTEWNSQTWAINAIAKLLLALAVMKVEGVI